MTRFACLLLLSVAASLSALGQEVIVFSDHRSLVVASHREQGLWTYLRVDGGELAVKTAQITQIRKEGAEAQQSAKAAAAAAPSPSAGGPPTGPTPPSPKPPPPPPKEDVDEGEPPPPPETQPSPPPPSMGAIRSTMNPPGGRPPVAPTTKKPGDNAEVGR